MPRTDLEKATAFIEDKNHSLPDVSRELDIPLPTLKAYRSDPDKLRTAAWERVFKLAQALDN